MNSTERRIVRAVVILATVAAVGGLSVGVAAQRGRGAGGGSPEAARTLKSEAPIDLTGYWVSVITEDWRWRMLTPEKGDVASVPLNKEGLRVADTWDPAKDETIGNQCKAYGAAGLMRLPTRLHITWQDDNTLKVETDTGQQTRLLHFGAQPAIATATWQGVSTAVWEVPEGGGRGGAATRTGQLRVETRHLKAGYLRKNGVPYAATAKLTEYFARTAEDTDEWLIVTAIVDDPLYLTEPFITSSNFKKEPDGSKWSPTPCGAR